MSDALPEDLWVNSFLSSPPKPLHASLQKRLQTSTNHLNSLAEIYKQRAAIEAQYAESLAKLVKQAESGSLLPKSSGPDWEKSSGEAKLWDSVIGEISETSTSHSTLSALLRTDFENPIRELPSKIVPWRRIREQDASLEKTLKEHEKVSAKLEKAANKSKSSKADQLSSELSDLTSSLASLSPMVYTTYQRLDEERYRSLKEILVRWGTVRADMAQRDGERAERVVALLVSWENQEEVAAVGRKLGGGRGSSSNIPSLKNASTPVDRRASIATQSTTNDFSPRPTPRQNGSSSNANTATPSFAGGLKSMLGRKNTLGPGQGRSGSYATSTRSATNERDETYDATITRSSVASPVDAEGFSVAPADRHRSPWDEPDESIPTPALAPAPANTSAGSNSGRAFSASPAQSTEELASPTPSQNTSNAPKLNLALASAPIEETEEERQAALQKMQQTLQMQPAQQPSRRQTIARGRRDVRNTMFGMPANGTEVVSAISPTRASSNDEGLISAQNAQNRPDSGLAVGRADPFGAQDLGDAASIDQGGRSGLRATMVESITASTRNGQVESILVSGEIHLSLRPQKPILGPIHIRLSEFERLEKIAPNPAFLAQVPDRPGEYFLNAEVLSAATANATSSGTLLFRYQVHIPPEQEAALLPLSVEPAFRCADGETRMILNYKRNGASTLGRITNLTLAATFEPGASVSNVQAKPVGGKWSPSSRRMIWAVGEGEEGKIIAKFINEPGQTLSPLGVLASWEVQGELCSGMDLSVVKGELEADVDFAQVEKSVVTAKHLAQAIVS